MQRFCDIHDTVARTVISMANALELIGVRRVRARRMAVDYLARECGIPLAIAEVVYGCLMDYHNVCSLGNKVCAIDGGRCSKWNPVKLG